MTKLALELNAKEQQILNLEIELLVYKKTCPAKKTQEQIDYIFSQGQIIKQAKADLEAWKKLNNLS